jgi:hypothetical protein
MRIWVGGRGSAVLRTGFVAEIEAAEFRPMA